MWKTGLRRAAGFAARSWWAPALLATGLGAGAAAPVPEELPAETLGTTVLSPKATERIYVADIAINHINDGRIRVFDAPTGRLQGMVPLGFVGNFTLSSKADELYVATTYLTRGVRGERLDLLEIYDTATLGFKAEVLLPTRRAQALTYRGLVRTTANGQFVLVQNATPATSITIVDLAQRKVVGEVQTPGCWGVLPAASHPTRFSMLCGDGRVATVTLDAQGQVADRQASEPLFNADADAWFHHAEQIGDRYWFVSFQGVLTELNLGGAVAQRKSALSLVTPEQRQQAHWRPGGYQLFTIDPAGRYLVVAMHDKGGEGSHKRPATELWTFDLASGQRVATAPGQGTVSLTISHSGKRLQALDGETGELRVWAWHGADPWRPMSTVKPAGDTSLLLESHD